MSLSYFNYIIRTHENKNVKKIIFPGNYNYLLLSIYLFIFSLCMYVYSIPISICMCVCVVLTSAAFLVTITILEVSKVIHLFFLPQVFFFVPIQREYRHIKPSCNKIRKEVLVVWEPGIFSHSSWLSHTWASGNYCTCFDAIYTNVVQRVDINTIFRVPARRNIVDCTTAWICFFSDPKHLMLAITQDNTKRIRQLGLPIVTMRQLN